MNRIASFVLSLFLLSACSPALRDTATQVAVASKGVVDTGASAWTTYVAQQIDKCRALDLPTPEARENCLGPAAEAEKVQLAFEAVHAAQLTLFVALVEDDDAAVMTALSDLAAKVQLVKKQLQAAGLLGGVK